MKIKLKKTLSNMLLIIVILISLYPLFSNILKFNKDSNIIKSYQKALIGITQSKQILEIEKAERYNKKLKEIEKRFLFTNEDYEEYMSLLNIQRNGLMGYITAETAAIKNLPIYHSTTSEILEIGAGHLEGTSLPVGGEGTHSAISGHSGMINQKMFTDLHKMDIGDEFVLEVMGEELRYEVDQIEIVEPDDLSLLDIEEGKDYCTLITCTPLGLNTHRLLVRGCRVTEKQAVEETKVTIIKENKGDGGARRVLQRFSEYELVMAGIAVMIIVVFLVPDGVRWMKGRLEKK